MSSPTSYQWQLTCSLSQALLYSIDWFLSSSIFGMWLDIEPCSKFCNCKFNRVMLSFYLVATFLANIVNYCCEDGGPQLQKGSKCHFLVTSTVQ